MLNFTEITMPVVSEFAACNTLLCHLIIGSPTAMLVYKIMNQNIQINY